ncbi:MAG: hypothetical protein ACRDQA_24190 [Nocardioidaceae bacterium]
MSAPTAGRGVRVLAGEGGGGHGGYLTADRRGVDADPWPGTKLDHRRLGRGQLEEIIERLCRTGRMRITVDLGGLTTLRCATALPTLEHMTTVVRGYGAEIGLDCPTPLSPAVPGPAGLRGPQPSRRDEQR